MVLINIDASPHAILDALPVEWSWRLSVRIAEGQEDVPKLAASLAQEAGYPDQALDVEALLFYRAAAIPCATVCGACHDRPCRCEVSGRLARVCVSQTPKMAGTMDGVEVFERTIRSAPGWLTWEAAGWRLDPCGGWRSLDAAWLRLMRDEEPSPTDLESIDRWLWSIPEPRAPLEGEPRPRRYLMARRSIYTTVFEVL